MGYSSSFSFDFFSPFASTDTPCSDYIQRINTRAAFINHPQTAVTVTLWNDEN